jgi:hypothetical protein
MPEAGEFIVGMSHGYLETAGSVDVVDALETRENMVQDVACRDVFDGDEM